MSLMCRFVCHLFLLQPTKVNVESQLSLLFCLLFSLKSSLNSIDDALTVREDPCGVMSVKDSRWCVLHCWSSARSSPSTPRLLSCPSLNSPGLTSQYMCLHMGQGETDYSACEWNPVSVLLIGGAGRIMSSKKPKINSRKYYVGMIEMGGIFFQHFQSVYICLHVLIIVIQQ